MNTHSNKLVIISGPSGVGKTKLVQSFRKFFPNISAEYEPLVYYVSREARPDERNGVDRFFVSSDEIEKFKNNDRYIVAKARRDLHAICIDDVLKALARTNVIYEGSPFLAVSLMNHEYLSQIPKVSVFISPLSKEEVMLFSAKDSKMNLKDAVERIISMKLLKRALRQKPILSVDDYEDISLRAASAFEEIKLAVKFDFVIPNHDGEESENWDCFFYPVGDARKTLLLFAKILSGDFNTYGIENWSDVMF